MADDSWYRLFPLTGANFSMARKPQHMMDDETSFGFSRIRQSEKQGRVDAVFDTVAHRYDIMNDVISGGMHRMWKDALVAWLQPPRHTERPFRVLDVAGGTGDIAFRIARAGGPAMDITLVDINETMLQEGRRRALHDESNIEKNLCFVKANAEKLPFRDRQFDAYTIAFGIRNVPDMQKALDEAYRVLVPGGRFLCLELPPVNVPVLDKLYERYSFDIVPKLGELIVGDGEPYRYLVESIRRFPNQARFADMIRRAGFSRVRYRNLSGGIVAIHSAWRFT